MLPSRLEVLIVDHSEIDARAIKVELVKAGFEPVITRVETEAEYRAHLFPAPDIILSDYQLPRFGAMRALQIARDGDLDIPFLIVSGTIGEETAVSAMQNGANDYLLKDRLGRLGMAIKQALAQRKLREAERHARQAEAESAERLKLVLAAAKMGVWEWDLAKDTVYWSPECLEIVGIKSFDGTLTTAQSFTHPEDVESLKASVANAIETHSRFAAEFRIIRTDGEVRWISNIGRCDYDPNGLAKRLLGNVQDITDRKLAEHAIADSEARYRLALAAVQKQAVVLERIAIGAPLNSVLQEIVDLVEEQVAGSLCSIHLVDRERRRLQFAAGGNLPASFAQAIPFVTIGPQAGSCGTAAYFGKSVIVEDIATDPLWEGCRELALSNGLRSCWSVPILTGSSDESPLATVEVLGTFALYRSEPSVPDAEAEAVLATAVHLARVAIDRETAFRTIRESEARYAAISEITRSVTFGLRFKSNGTAAIEWVRPRFGLLSGYSEQEFGNNGWEMLFHPDDRNRVKELFGQIAAGQVRREELRYLTKTGETLNVLVQGQLIERGPGPDEGLIIGGFLDITELKAVEVALRASEERFQLALRGANEGLWDWNIKSNQLFLSPRWKSMLGYEEDEPRDHFDTWLDLMHPDDHATALARLHDFLNGPSDNYESEFRMRHKSGEYRIILSRAFLIRDEQGIPARMVGTHQNITERKLADEELRASRQRLEVLSRQLITMREAELRHLARELHDEIGQVLTAMKMNLRSLQRSVDANLHERLEENISMIDHAVEQVRNLSLNMRPPHLDDLGLVATLHWYLKNQAEIAGFEEHLTVVPAEIQVPSDLATVCFRITQEAVTNSVRHAAARKIEIELRQYDKELHLAICDNGVGFNVKEARERASNGTSLGLISMQERASLAGGRIEIQSIPGRGTTVHAWFPLTHSR